MVNLPEANARSISVTEAEQRGVFAKHEVMTNGERRFRLIGPDGSSYIRTEASAVGAWQVSHFHAVLSETYIVEKEWMVLVQLVGEKQLVFQRLHPGDIVTTRMLVPHNVYLAAKAVVHTVKHGVAECLPDWHPSTLLDSLTLSLSEDELLALVEAIS
jgi:hypothetical protein